MNKKDREMQKRAQEKRQKRAAKHALKRANAKQEHPLNLSPGGLFLLGQLRECEGWYRLVQADVDLIERERLEQVGFVELAMQGADSQVVAILDESNMTTPEAAVIFAQWSGGEEGPGPVARLGSEGSKFLAFFELVQEMQTTALDLDNGPWVKLEPDELVLCQRAPHLFKFFTEKDGTVLGRFVAPEEPTEYPQEEYDAKVLEALRFSEGSCSAEHIRDVVGGTLPQARAAMHRLAESGQVREDADLSDLEEAPYFRAQG